MPPSQTDSDDGTVTIDSFVEPDGSDPSTGSEGVCIGAGLDDPAGPPDALDSAASADIEAHAIGNWIESQLPVGVCSHGHNDRLVLFGDDVSACRAELLDLVRESEGCDKVVLTGWLVYCDNLASLSSWLDALLSEGATVTALGSDVVLTPDGLDGAGVPALLGELSAAAIDPREHPEEQIEVLEYDWSGRTPIGTEVEAGNLVPSQDWSRVRAHLLDVVEGSESRTWASNRIGCSLRTVSRILDDSERREWYRLPAASGSE